MKCTLENQGRNWFLSAMDELLTSFSNYPNASVNKLIENGHEVLIVMCS